MNWSRPSVSILCQPSVAVVDEVTRVNGTVRLATEYINYLYSDEAQRLAAEYYYRPSNPENPGRVWRPF